MKDSLQSTRLSYQNQVGKVSTLNRHEMMKNVKEMKWLKKSKGIKVSYTMLNKERKSRWLETQSIHRHRR